MLRFFLFHQKISLRTFSVLLCFVLLSGTAYSQVSHENTTENKTTTTQRIVATTPHSSLKLDPSPWQRLEPGLEYATFTLQDKGTASTNTIKKLEVLRFSPQFFTFSLHTISEKNSYPLTLQQWAIEHNLVAAINASMYLPDGRTSTGYMRSATHINNKRISKAFGVFFLAAPSNDQLPSAILVEKNNPKLEELFTQYRIIIQNYRLISAKGEVLWSERGQKHSIAAVGMDTKGHILFLHCRQPIAAHNFAVELLRLPLHLGPVMYVEGGAQAGMVLRHKDKNTFWGGRHPADFFMGSVGVALPNILGVKRKKTLNQ